MALSLFIVMMAVGACAFMLLFSNRALFLFLASYFRGAGKVYTWLAYLFDRNGDWSSSIECQEKANKCNWEADAMLEKSKGGREQ
jgi:hypothetical protein